MPRDLIERLWSRGKEFLGVEYPILGGAMTWISESSLVSAISEAGAFGVLAGGNMPLNMLKDEIHRIREKTGKPFGVNLIAIAPNFADHLDHVLGIIRDNCRSRIALDSTETESTPTVRPRRTFAEVGSAAVFVWDIERFETY